MKIFSESLVEIADIVPEWRKRVSRGSSAEEDEYESLMVGDEAHYEVKVDKSKSFQTKK